MNTWDGTLKVNKGTTIVKKGMCDSLTFVFWQDMRLNVRARKRFLSPNFLHTEKRTRVNASSTRLTKIWQMNNP